MQALIKVRPVLRVPALHLRMLQESKRQGDYRVEQIVEFMLVAQVRPQFAPHGIDCGLIQAPRAVHYAIRQRTPQADGAGAALFQSGSSRYA